MSRNDLTAQQRNYLRTLAPFRGESYATMVCTDLVIKSVAAAFDFAPLPGSPWWARASLWPVTQPTPTSGLEALNEKLPALGWIADGSRCPHIGSVAIAQGWSEISGPLDGVGDRGHTFVVLPCADKPDHVWVIESTDRVAPGQDRDAGPRVAGVTGVDLDDALSPLGRPTDLWPEAAPWSWWVAKYPAALNVLILPPVPA